MVRRRVIGTGRATVAGMGAIRVDLRWENLEMAETLQFMETNIITNIDCTIRARLYSSVETRVNTQVVNIYSGHLCTLGRSGVRICFADSGSPVITEDGVVGVVVSGLIMCSRYLSGAPDIYVRVSTYLSWIDSYIHDLS